MEEQQPQQEGNKEEEMKEAEEQKEAERKEETMQDAEGAATDTLETPLGVQDEVGQKAESKFSLAQVRTSFPLGTGVFAERRVYS